MRLPSKIVSIHAEINPDADVAVILSCPGKCEANKGHPAAGKTGENLDYVLMKISSALESKVFLRDQVTITNSSTKPLFKKRDGRSEARSSEILNEENLERLRIEIGKARILLVFGRNANRATTALAEKYADEFYPKHIISLPHPGAQALNRRYRFPLGTPMCTRLDLLAESAIASLKNISISHQ